MLSIALEALAFALDNARATVLLVQEIIGPEPENDGACPHPEDDREDTSTMGEKSFLCKRCGEHVILPAPCEDGDSSAGSSSPPGD